MLSSADTIAPRAMSYLCRYTPYRRVGGPGSNDGSVHLFVDFSEMDLAGALSSICMHALRHRTNTATNYDYKVQKEEYTGKSKLHTKVSKT